MKENGVIIQLKMTLQCLLQQVLTEKQLGNTTKQYKRQLFCTFAVLVLIYVKKDNCIFKVYTRN